MNQDPTCAICGKKMLGEDRQTLLFCTSIKTRDVIFIEKHPLCGPIKKCANHECTRGEPFEIFEGLLPSDIYINMNDSFQRSIFINYCSKRCEISDNYAATNYYPKYFKKMKAHDILIVKDDKDATIKVFY